MINLHQQCTRGRIQTLTALSRILLLSSLNFPLRLSSIPLPARLFGSSSRSPRGTNPSVFSGNKKRKGNDKPYVPRGANKPQHDVLSTFPKFSGPDWKVKVQEQNHAARSEETVLDRDVTAAMTDGSQKRARKIKTKTSLHKIIKQKNVRAALKWEEEEDALIEQEIAEFMQQEEEDAAAMQLEAESASQPVPSTPRSPPALKFGIQTLLKFFANFDITVRTSSKMPTARDRKKTVVEEEKTEEERKTEAGDANPMNQDIIIYDVPTRSPFADYLVVVKATSSRQMRHLAETCYKMSRALNACAANPRTLSLEGRDREDWMFLDAGHIWVYFMNKNPPVELSGQDHAFINMFTSPAQLSPLDLNSSVHSNPWFEATPDRVNTMHKERVVPAKLPAPSISPLPFTAFTPAYPNDPHLLPLYTSSFQHVVLENLERHYSDCRVPPEEVANVKDYAHDAGGDRGETEMKQAKRRGKKKEEGDVKVVQSMEVKAGMHAEEDGFAFIERQAELDAAKAKSL